MKRIAQKTLAVLLSLLIMLSAMSISVLAVGSVIASGYCGGEGDGTNLSWELTEDGTLTISGSGKMAEYINCYSSPFYKYRSQIKCAVLNFGVTSVGSYAFNDCIGLTTITMPSSVTSVGYHAFGCCISLTSIEVDSGNSAYCSIDGVLFSKDKTELICYPAGKKDTFYSIPNSVTSIGYAAFEGCTVLTSVTIPDSVISIGEYAFYSCTGLTSITIANGVTSIGNYAFWECANLTSITIPDSVTSIGDSVFRACTGLTSVTISKSVTSIGNYAFYDCTSLTSVTIPNGVTSIGKEAFYNCESLTSVTIGDGVTSIGDSAFSACESLISITIPNSVTSIGSYAFVWCTGLTSITMPNSVTSIGEGAFNHCESLTSIEVDSNNSSYCSIDGVLFSKDKTLIICYPAGKKDTSYSIPNSVTSIGNGVFDYCAGLITVKIPSSVTCINFGVFAGCTGLTDIYCEAESQPDGWDDEWRFGCSAEVHWGWKGAIIASGYCGGEGDGTNLSWELTEDGTLTISGNGAMKDYAGVSPTVAAAVMAASETTSPWTAYTEVIEKLVISEGVTHIGAYSFYNCENLSGVSLPSSMESIGDNAFYGCDALDDVDYSGDWDGVDVGEGNEPIEKPNKLCGDVDGDGEITSIDRVTLSRYLASWEGYETINEAAADVNKDGKINSQDRVILSRYLAKWEGYETLPYIK